MGGYRVAHLVEHYSLRGRPHCSGLGLSPDLYCCTKQSGQKSIQIMFKKNCNISFLDLFFFSFLNKNPFQVNGLAFIQPPGGASYSMILDGRERHFDLTQHYYVAHLVNDNKVIPVCCNLTTENTVSSTSRKWVCFSAQTCSDFPCAVIPV